MDTIWNCAFGVDIDLQNDTQNEYFTKAEMFFNSFNHLNVIFYAGG